jgi:hypothetical protein
VPWLSNLSFLPGKLTGEVKAIKIPPGWWRSISVPAKPVNSMLRNFKVYPITPRHAKAVNSNKITDSLLLVPSFP